MTINEYLNLLDVVPLAYAKACLKWSDIADRNNRGSYPAHTDKEFNSLTEKQTHNIQGHIFTIQDCIDHNNRADTEEERKSFEEIGEGRCEYILRQLPL